MANSLRCGVSSLGEGVFESPGLPTGLVGSGTHGGGRIVPVTREGGGGKGRGLSLRDLLVNDFQFDGANGQPIASRQFRHVEGTSVEPRIFVDPPNEGGLRAPEYKTMPRFNTRRSQAERTSIVRPNGAFEIRQPDNVTTVLAAADAEDQIVRWRAQQASATADGQFFGEFNHCTECMHGSGFVSTSGDF
jgi:hypothetical protein